MGATVEEMIKKNADKKISLSAGIKKTENEKKPNKSSHIDGLKKTGLAAKLKKNENFIAVNYRPWDDCPFIEKINLE